MVDLRPTRTFRSDLSRPDGGARPLRPSTSLRITRLARGDRGAVREVYLGLSQASRKMRFLVEMPPEPPPTVLRLLADADQVDHVAFVATLGDRPVGIGRWVRDRAHPDEAEAAFSVVDDLQGLGVGSALLRQVIHSALSSGVRTIVSTHDPANLRVARLIAPWGGSRRYVDGLIEHRVPLEWNSLAVADERPAC